jgi:hypothetical protein
VCLLLIPRGQNTSFWLVVFTKKYHLASLYNNTTYQSDPGQDIYQRILYPILISQSRQKGYFLSLFEAGYFWDIITLF